jgi:hypothetical protein
VTVTPGLIAGVVAASPSCADVAFSPGGLLGDLPFWFELSTCAPAVIPAKSNTESAVMRRSALQRCVSNKAK